MSLPCRVLSLAVAATLALPGAARAKTAAKPPEKPAVANPAATGTDLPLFEPTTAPITVAGVFERLKEVDDRMGSLTLTYRQTIRLEESASPQSKECELTFLKPKKLRIEYLKPEPQTVVSDGAKFWVWRKWSNQVIESSAADWRKAEPALEGLLNFGAYAELRRNYDVSVATVAPAGPDRHRAFSLELRPKAKDAGFVLVLKMSTKNYFPLSARLTAAGASVITEFDKTRFNPDVPKSLFDFTPPKGADVFHYPSNP